MKGNGRNLDNSKCFWTDKKQTITKYSQLGIQTLCFY